MDYLAFIIVCVVVVVLAWGGTWIVGQIPGCPAVIPKIIWGVAIFIIVVTLLKAFGGASSSVTIPRIG